MIDTSVKVAKILFDLLIDSVERLRTNFHVDVMSFMRNCALLLSRFYSQRNFSIRIITILGDRQIIACSVLLSGFGNSTNGGLEGIESREDIQRNGSCRMKAIDRV